MDPVTIGGWVAALIAAIGALAALRTKRGDIWKNEAEAYKSKAERLEADLNAFKAEFQDYKRDTSHRIDRLEDENRTLRSLATSHDAVVALTDLVETNHSQIMAAIAAN